MRHASAIRIHAAEKQPVEGSRITQVRGAIDERFGLTQMGALLNTLDACVADLKKVWNVKESPPGENAGGGRIANPPLESLFSADDYPQFALDKGQTGVVRFALLIDEKGKVADCTVVATSGVASLDMQTCGLLQSRAQYIPITGPDGKPVKDAVIGKIRWQIPGD